VRVAAERSGDEVRETEDRRRVPPGHRERERARHHFVDASECGQEVIHAGRRGAPPAVDGLVRVTDGGHRVPGSEQSGKQLQLGVRGVLELVEQHDAIPGPLGLGDRRDRG